MTTINEGPEAQESGRKDTIWGKIVAKWQYYAAALGIVVLVGLGVGLPLGLIYGGGVPGDAVAKVGGKAISEADFKALVENYTLQYGITEESQPDIYRELAADVLESQIARALAVQKAPEYGLSVSEEEVQAEFDMVVDYYFQGDLAAAEERLKADGMTVDGAKAGIRDDMLVGLVQDEVTKDETPASEEDILAYYEDNQDLFMASPTRNVRHILVAAAGSFDRDTPAEEEYTDIQWARALATAAKVRVDLMSGGSWRSLAARYSDDGPTRNLGGDLGEVAQDGELGDIFGRIVESEIFSLEADQISELVQTAYGYHIIEVTSVNEPQVKPLDEVREEIAMILLDEAKLKVWRDWIEAAKQDIKVIYRDDMRPTTTTLLNIDIVSPTTTTDGEETTTTQP